MPRKKAFKKCNEKIEKKKQKKMSIFEELNDKDFSDFNNDYEDEALEEQN